VVIIAIFQRAEALLRDINFHADECVRPFQGIDALELQEVRIPVESQRFDIMLLERPFLLEEYL